MVLFSTTYAALPLRRASCVPVSQLRPNLSLTSQEYHYYRMNSLLLALLDIVYSMTWLVSNLVYLCDLISQPSSLGHSVGGTSALLVVGILLDRVPPECLLFFVKL